MGRTTNPKFNPLMKIEIFVVDGEEVKVDRTYVIENKKAPEVPLQQLVDEAYKILDDEMWNEAQRLSEHND